jgi:hypothetical protein
VKELMSEDDAQAWLQGRKIRLTVKPSIRIDNSGWRYRPMRSPDSLNIIVDQKSAVSLLKFISQEAWEKYPTKKTTVFGQRLRSFFAPEELRELYSEFLEDPDQEE